jgi:hypothetical protein
MLGLDLPSFGQHFLESPLTVFAPMAAFPERPSLNLSDPFPADAEHGGNLLAGHVIVEIHNREAYTRLLLSGGY